MQGVSQVVIPTAAALTNSNVDDSVLLLLYDAVEDGIQTSRWSDIAVSDLLADLESACNLRGIDIPSGTKEIRTVINLLR
jgi:hypothetical protein